MDFFNFFDVKTYNWVTENRLLASFNPKIHGLLCETNSLTQRIKHYSHFKITPSCVFFGRSRLHPLEQSLLSSQESHLWLRCMVWKVTTTLWMRTRCAFSSHPALAPLHTLGNQPLGEILFSQPIPPKRSPLRYARGLYKGGTAPCCIRVSTLYYAQQPLAVSEVLYADALINDRTETC